MASAAVYDDIEQDAGNYMIGTNTPQVSASVLKKSSQNQSGPNFNVPSKLEPLVLLAKNARGASAAALIGQAIGTQGVFVFSELLQSNGIKDLQHDEKYGKNYRLLEIFAYGIWSDYVQQQASLPELTKAQTTKMKQLTILSLAMTDRIIPYSVLLSTLDLPSVPVLEDLLIESIYAGLLTGRLDQKESRLEVIACLGRDVRMLATSTNVISMEVDQQHPLPDSSHSIASLTEQLTAFLSTLNSILASLEVHVGRIAADAINDIARLDGQTKMVELIVAEVSKKDETKGGHNSRTITSTNEGGGKRGENMVGKDQEAKDLQRAIEASLDEGTNEMDVETNLTTAPVESGRGTGKAKKRGRA